MSVFRITFDNRFRKSASRYVQFNCQAQAQVFLWLSPALSNSLSLALRLALSHCHLSLKLTLNLVCHQHHPPTTKLFLGFKWLQTITVRLLTMTFRITFRSFSQFLTVFFWHLFNSCLTQSDSFCQFLTVSDSFLFWVWILLLWPDFRDCGLWIMICYGLEFRL